MPQPNLVPVIPSTSRSTQSSGMSLGASKLWSSPLIFKFMMTNLRRCGILNGVQHSCIERIYCANAEWAAPVLRLKGDGESWNFRFSLRRTRPTGVRISLSGTHVSLRLHEQEFDLDQDVVKPTQCR